MIRAEEMAALIKMDAAPLKLRLIGDLNERNIVFAFVKPADHTQGLKRIISARPV